MAFHSAQPRPRAHVPRSTGSRGWNTRRPSPDRNVQAMTVSQTGSCRTLVVVADDDEVRLEHAIEAYRSLPDAELTVVPGTSHGLLVEKPGLCNLLITEFLTKEPAPTFAPIHRAALETR
jgi:pimeloyl-ACP methyl ester carboxylesterase